MGEARVYSERLGGIRDAQFAAAAERLKLGRFVKAEPISSGLFGQNVFVATTDGEYVLRGAPHWVRDGGDAAYRREDRWQFTKEKFFARQLHERTNAPAPWPMLHDETCDIFGWPYLVMPKMPGICFDDHGILRALDPEDRRDVATAMGEMLAQMQTLTSPFAGDVSTVTIALEPYPHGNTQRVIEQTALAVATARTHGSMTQDDEAWIAAAGAQALGAGDPPATFTHGDYKLNNLTLLKDGGAWRVRGLFDLHTACFGDGALDTVRQAASYLDTEPALARVFLDAWRAAGGRPSGAHMPLYILNERAGLWAHFTQPDRRAAWTMGRTFRAWAKRYVDGVLALL